MKVCANMGDDEFQLLGGLILLLVTKWMDIHCEIHLE